ncbi:ABC transporter permease [Clostridium thailandense]|uniref:ABC transporter permease n=1 Tax=Clostridium thailandense TaxID=2794346 RepID=UPI003988ACE5
MNAKLRDLILTNFLAIFCGLLISSLMLLFLRISPSHVLAEALGKIITDKYTMGDVFLKATPLIFTALSFAFTFKANLFNIGSQGQFYMGAIIAIAVSLKLQGVMPIPLLLTVVCILTFIGGGMVGALIGYLKAKFNANEFLVSMMSSYVVLALMNYLLRTFLKETKGEYPQTDPITRQAWIPTLVEGTRLHVGFILAVLVAIGVWILLYKTPLGFRIRVVGSNASAAEMSGIQSRKICIITFFISGALAGAAGFTEVNGVQHMLIQDFNSGIGSAGIGIAILANANPIGIIFASILFAALNVVGTLIGRMPGVNVPSSFIDLMQGSVMVFVIASYFVRSSLEKNREKRKLQKAVRE